MYKRLAVPGEPGNFVTIKSGDVLDHLDIYYKKKHFYVTTRDILSMRSLSDVVKKVKTLGIGK